MHFFIFTQYTHDEHHATYLETCFCMSKILCIFTPHSLKDNFFMVLLNLHLFYLTFIVGRALHLVSKKELYIYIFIFIQKLEA